MVDRGGHLPGLPALVRRLRRRRHRRPAGHHVPARPPRRAGSRRGLAVPVLSVPAGRRRVRRGRLPRRRPAVRHARRRRQADRRGEGARAARDRRPGAQPHLVRAPLVHRGGGGRAGQPGAAALRHPRRQGPRRRRAAERLGERVRRPRLDAAARRAVVPAPVRLRPARPQLGQPGGARGVPRRAALLAGPRRRRLPGRRGARPDQAGRPGRLAGAAGDPLRQRRGQAAPADVGPGRRARDLPGVAAGARLVPR